MSIRVSFGLMLLVVCGPAASLRAEEKVGRETFANSLGMKFVRLPAGEFAMGSPTAAKYAGADEKPQHRVRIAKPFALGVHEVTRADYFRVMGTGKEPTAEEQRLPVDVNRWESAVEFCRKLSALPEEVAAKRTFRLPTEAEWEYACRAGTTTIFSHGDTLSAKQANFRGTHPFGDVPQEPYLGRPVAVGSYAPNPWGLHDMHGNVWEWCSDWFDEGWYAKSPVDDPTGPESAKYHAVRGGGYFYTGEYCRSASRSHPIRAGIGFRVVCAE